MDELKPKESEALDMLEAMLDVADMKVTGPLYADDPPRSGLCRIPEEDAAKLRQYIADRRATPENKPLTMDELHRMVGDPVYVKDIPPYDYAAWKVISDIDNKQVDFTEGDGYELKGYGKTWLAYARKPEGSEPHA